jgi:2,4-dienoyl-CoA reductase-like NADH-dependent reductase (Old Yellow Enzyme family)
MTDGVAKGNGIADGIAVARAIEARGAHLVVLSNGLNVESITAMFGSPFPKANRAAAANPVVRLGMWLQSLTEPSDVVFRENYLLEHARAVRRAVGMPLAYLGGMDSRAGVEQVLAEGFECVAAGRAFLYEPDLARRMRAEPGWRSGCNRSNLCVSTMYAPAGTYCPLKPRPDAESNFRPAAEADNA